MSNLISFFANNADDVSRARKFYERVFDWNFEPWGPPDFYLIRTGKEPEAAVGGGLQARRELVPNQKMVGRHDRHPEHRPSDS
jgi:predicted enzyme related to lactoylglutathione lyase